MAKIDWTKISGETYDWTKTLKPEKPYIHDYTKTFVYKLFLAIPNEEHNECIVYKNFEEALEVIKKIDKMTLNMPKIVYLVGWQYLGHDSKYPSWDKVNEDLKRPCDKEARDSLLWLMDEGFKYNTTVSLHINIQDAYDDSPLWDEYLKNDLISLKEDGSLCTGYMWNNKVSYIISLKKEWETGYLQKRIDVLCDFLPIQRAGTIHIDAMHAQADVGHGYSLEDIQAVRNKVVRYWRGLGIDVTSEFYFYETPDWQARKEQLTGLQPLAYHFSQNLDEYMVKPANLICGTVISRRYREGISDEMDKLFGSSFNVEGIIMNNGTDWEMEFFEEFCRKEVKYRYLMTLQRERATIEKKDISVEFSDGVETRIDNTMYKNGILLNDDNFIFVPIASMGKKAYLLYAKTAGVYKIDMAKAFECKENEKFIVRNFGAGGVSNDGNEAQLKNGIFEMSINSGKALVVSDR